MSRKTCLLKDIDRYGMSVLPLLARYRDANKDNEGEFVRSFYDRGRTFSFVAVLSDCDATRVTHFAASFTDQTRALRFDRVLRFTPATINPSRISLLTAADLV